MEYVKLKKGSKEVMWLHSDIQAAMWQRARVPKKAILTYIALMGSVSRGHHPSLSELATVKGSARISANVSRDIKRLEDAGMIEVFRAPAKNNQYKFPHPDFWKV